MYRMAGVSGRSVLAAAFLGALAAVALIPSARSTVTAQVAMVLARRPEWARAASGGSWRRLEDVAAAHPNDPDLQLGLATLPPSEPGTDDQVDGGPGMSRAQVAVLIERLEALARRFPGDVGIRAHLLRHLTREAIRVDRPEVADFTGHVPTAHRPRRWQKPSEGELALFLTTATEGARLEPSNAYFEAMRAAGEFAASQDAAALRDLHAAAAKPDWDDHATEETQAQWKLLTLAYGDRGMVQRSPGYEHLLFPHVELLRLAAHLSVWHAAMAEGAGNRSAALGIRHDLMRLGMTMASASPLIIGKSVGLAIFQIGTSPAAPEPPLSAPSAAAMAAAQRERRQRYERLLQARGDQAEADWVRAERERGEAIQAGIQRAVDSWQAVAPSTPEGWAGWWTFGILLLEQIAALVVLWVAVLLVARARPDPHSTASHGWPALAMALLVTAYLLIVVTPIFGLSWPELLDGMVPRLAAGLCVFLAALRYWARRPVGTEAAAARQSVLLCVTACLVLCLVSTVLWTSTGSIPLLRASLWSGPVALGLLAVAGRSGRRANSAQVIARWKPALVAFISVVPAVVLSNSVRDVLSTSNSFTMSLMAQHSPFWDAYPPADPWRFMGALLTMPCALLLLFQLLRVAALRQSLRAGLARGIRQTAPAAAAMLLAVYLVALVPTVAHDRAAERQIERMLTDQIRYVPEGPHARR